MKAGSIMHFYYIFSIIKFFDLQNKSLDTIHIEIAKSVQLLFRN